MKSNVIYIAAGLALLGYMAYQIRVMQKERKEVEAYNVAHAQAK